MPQILIGLFLVLNVVTATLKHGEPRGKHNAYTTALDAAIVASLLYWGGFFG